MFIYAFPFFTTISRPIITPIEIFTANSESFMKNDITLIIKSRKSSIRFFIENNYKEYYEYNKSFFARYYIVSNVILTNEDIKQIYDKLKSIYIDLNISAPKIITKNKYFYFAITTVLSIDEAVQRYKNIYLHYSTYSDGAFSFINIEAKDKSVDYGDVCTYYSTFSDRYKYCNKHGKVNNDGTVDIFEYNLPIQNVSKVYILNCNKFQKVTPNVYMLQCNNLIFWLISSVPILSTNCSIIQQPLYSDVNLNAESATNVKSILKTFNNYGFQSIKINERSIIAFDKDEETCMFIGVISDLSILKGLSKYV